ncbi:hypothetical protein [Natrinema versiforme]|uniref:Uncharacterized protein n=1 Tax=Natrinema versiforme JCM 10478 TaxID=1227496 RepID=L9XUX0_9EURY|nr:hypothetical protein [Natrinema versiforme]ELY65221.1 hypothetical protein C489_15612 [Natrinema versiforme JCM 10478]
MVPDPGFGSPPDDDPPPAADGAGAERSNPFARHVSRVVDRFDDLWPFASVPLFTALLEFEKVRRALGPTGRGFSINLEFAFPTPLVTLWQLADPPEPPAVPSRSAYGEPFGGAPGEPEPTGGSPGSVGSTGAVDTDVTIETAVGSVDLPLGALSLEMVGWIGLAVLVYVTLSGILLAAYVGGIDRRLRGEPIAVGACIVTYGPRYILYNLVVAGAFVLVFPLFVLVPPLILLAIPVIVALSYVFYPVPFLFVAADASLLEAFRRSLELTTAGGQVLSFGLWHLLAAVVASLVLSLLVSGGGAGFLLALCVSAPLGLVLTAATVSFFREDVAGEEAASTGGFSSDDSGSEPDDYGWADD